MSVRCRRRDERGAYLILFALLIVALLVTVAIVIDLGQARSTRRDSQNVADFAALAAAPKLAGEVIGGAFVRSSASACFEAFKYIRANLPDLPAAADMSSNTDGCPSLPAVEDCSDTTTPANAVASSAAPYSITIRYPVAASDIAPARTGDGAQCERLKVIVERTRPTSFAGVIGVKTQTIRASAVVKGAATSRTLPTPALLLLDRTTCGVLVSNSNQSGVEAQAFETQPGYIHADSDASNANCGNSAPNPSNPSGWVVYGTQLSPSAPRSRQPAIVARDTTATPSMPGVISLRAMTTRPTNAAAKTTLNSASDIGVVPNPTAGSVIGRGPVDTRYRTAIQNLKATTDALVTNPVAAGYVRLSTTLAGCSMNQLVTLAKVYVDCTISVPNGSTLTFLSPYVVTSGPITVNNGGTLNFVDTAQLVVRNTDPTTPGISVTGTLNVNLGPTGTIAGGASSFTPGAGFTCRSRATTPPATPPSATSPTVSYPISTRLVVTGGGLANSTSSASTRLCQTTLYLSNLATPNGSPSPTFNGNAALVDVGNGSIDWTAPNLRYNPACVVSSVPDCYQTNEVATWTPALQPTTTVSWTMEFEDLAFWTEASGTGGPGLNNSFTSGFMNSIGGGGSVSTTGVFFSPNAHVRYAGQAASNVGDDAQFIARSLYLSGSANMRLRPNPRNSIPIPEPIYALIR